MLNNVHTLQVNQKSVVTYKDAPEPVSSSHRLCVVAKWHLTLTGYTQDYIKQILNKASKHSHHSCWSVDGESVLVAQPHQWCLNTSGNHFHFLGCTAFHDAMPLDIVACYYCPQ
jgi:hypothetical protein